jgi:hypothetical protein
LINLWEAAWPGALGWVRTSTPPPTHPRPTWAAIYFFGCFLHWLIAQFRWGILSRVTYAASFRFVSLEFHIIREQIFQLGRKLQKGLFFTIFLIIITFWTEHISNPSWQYMSKRKFVRT